jgi:hypothetical protein
MLDLSMKEIVCDDQRLASLRESPSQVATAACRPAHGIRHVRPDVREEPRRFFCGREVVDEAGRSVARAKDLTPQHPSNHPRHRERMHQQGIEPPERAVGLMENSKLPQDGGSIVIDLLASESIVVVECEDCAQLK